MNQDTSTAALVQSIQADARRLGLTWSLRPATTVVDSIGLARVIMDGDTVPLPVVSIIGSLQTNTRVMVMLIPPSGAYVIGFLGEQSPTNAPRGRIAYISRATSSTAAVAATPVLRLDGVPLTTGRHYQVGTSSLILIPSVATNVISARLSYTLDGTSATTGSALMALGNNDASSTAHGTNTTLVYDYTPSTDEELSVLLYTLTASGAGTTRILAGIGGLEIQLWVQDLGVATQTGTGTVL